MGANHDHDNAQSPGYHPYSHGLQVPEHGYRTIMAYSCAGCARINQWSNPAVSVAGATTGVSDWADNARTLNQTAKLTAQFRQAESPPPAPKAATIHNPEDGSILAGTAVPFSWHDTGAEAYRLRVGTNDDPGRFYDAVLGLQTDTFVPGLPHDGSAVVARLTSLLPGGWVATEASYVSYSAPLGTPTITYPTTGTTLGTGAVDVRWSYDPTATMHQLVVFDGHGTEVASAETPGQAATLNLPCGAGALHLTLYSQRPDSWVESAATYSSTSCP